MSIKTLLAIWAGKKTAWLSRVFGLGKGSSAPGMMALMFDKDIIYKLSTQIRKKKIVISATNGKTTTSKMIAHIFAKNHMSFVRNSMGANLDRGIASALLEKSDIWGRLDVDYGIFEVDEAYLPQMIEEIKPDIVVLGNLFRDQLDRYGEIDTLANKWLKSLKNNQKDTQIVLNIDDPAMMYLGKHLDKKNTIYYAVTDNNLNENNELEHAADSTMCLFCSGILQYKSKVFSHLGDYKCTKCSFGKDEAQFIATNIISDIDKISFDIKYKNQSNKIKLNFGGIYNLYNALAAFTVSKLTEIEDETIMDALAEFTPAFGRMETFEYKSKKFKIILIKNPTGANAAISSLQKVKDKKIAIFLNDNIADGKDVSWIWDVDFETLKNVEKIYCLGKRKHDLALRLKYGNVKNVQIVENVDCIDLIDKMAQNIDENECGYLLPTYTAMLELRKQLENKNIINKI